MQSLRFLCRNEAFVLQDLFHRHCLTNTFHSKCHTISEMECRILQLQAANTLLYTSAWSTRLTINTSVRACDIQAVPSSYHKSHPTIKTSIINTRRELSYDNIESRQHTVMEFAAMEFTNQYSQSYVLATGVKYLYGLSKSIKEGALGHVLGQECRFRPESYLQFFL